MIKIDWELQGYRNADLPPHLGPWYHAGGPEHAAWMRGWWRAKRQAPPSTAGGSGMTGTGEMGASASGTHQISAS